MLISWSRKRDWLLNKTSLNRLSLFSALKKITQLASSRLAAAAAAADNPYH